MCRIRLWAVPSPPARLVLLESTLQHLHYIFAENGSITQRRQYVLGAGRKFCALTGTSIRGTSRRLQCTGSDSWGAG